METGLQTLNHQQRTAMWAERIQACRSSGQTVQIWCRENGVSQASYYKWQRRIFNMAASEAARYRRAGKYCTAAVPVGSVHQYTVSVLRQTPGPNQDAVLGGEQFALTYNEAEANAYGTKTATEEQIRVKENARRHSGSIEDVIPESLPVETIEHHPDDIYCPVCGTEMVVIGKEVRKTLKITPPQY